MATRARFVRIGNSRGRRLPKALIEQAELTDEIELHAEPGRIIVQAVREARVGWAEAAKRMHASATTGCSTNRPRRSSTTRIPVSQRTVEAVARVGGRIVITVYPPEPD